MRGTDMLPEQWETFKRAARLEKMDKVPMAMIVDSPWIPGYLGIKHMDYYLDPELWFQSNLKIMREFPDIIPIQGYRRSKRLPGTACSISRITQISDLPLIRKTVPIGIKSGNGG
jgi:hypothetical protein